MICILLAGLSAPPQTELPRLKREFRAAWIATVDNIDWPSKRTLSTSRQRQELTAIFDRASEIGLNALIFQVRPSGDALYDSPIEPWSEYLTNRQGTAPNPRWDPLAEAVQMAHDRGIELHVWLNPYRANHPAQKGPLAESHIGRKRPDLVKTYGRYQWMDPGEPDVQKRILAVTRELIKRYDIDGVHIDDYFYPYPEKGQPFPDDQSYAAYRKRGGTLAKDDWRRKNVDDVVQGMYRTIRSERTSVKFGISPFGIYRPGIPEGIRAGVDQYSQLYADARKWLREGWCDYFSPQLYWPIEQTAQSFPRLLDYWLSENKRDRHVWPGLYTSRVIPSLGNWPPREIARQIGLIRDRGAEGEIHFSFVALQKNPNGLTDSLRGSVYSQTAFVPSSPWMGKEDLPRPTLRRVGDSLKWAIPAKPTLWAMWRRYGRQWLINRYPANQTDFEWGSDSRPDEVAIAAIGRYGEASEPARLVLR